MNRIPLKLTVTILLLTGFTACQKNKVKDIDGNVYKTVTIGTQVWMAENLKTTRFNDGTSIPHVTSYDSWPTLTSPAYCWYNNDSTNKDVYGALYNWYAVNTNKLCPKGWHVPTNNEWTTMIVYLGGARIAGGDLKEAGTEHWRSPNDGATNVSGFTALPGGFRSYNGSFNYQRISGYWWSSTEYSTTNVFFWNLRYKLTFAFQYVSDKPNGFCIRCMMDQ